MSGTRSKKPAAGVAWESPPLGDRPDWSVVASTLRTHPMQWLKVYEHGRETWANAIGRGRIRALRPDLGFETRTIDNTRDSPRTCTLFMRWNPDRVDPITDVLTGGN